MAGEALLETQKGIYVKLTGDATLMALITGVFDGYSGVPDKTAFPYVTIGDSTELSFDTLKETGKEMTITLHIWSLHRGKKEALNILKRINVLLEYGTITITGYVLTFIRFDNADTFVLDDGPTIHVPARYRIKVREA